jgi:hypothetical protein
VVPLSRRSKVPFLPHSILACCVLPLQPRRLLPHLPLLCLVSMQPLLVPVRVPHLPM